MSATYDSTLPNDRNWVRFLVGDITPSRALLQDDEIDGVLEEEARTVTIAAALKYFAAARCIDIIHTRYATAGAHQGGVMMKRVDDLARSFGVSASTSAALDEKTRDLRKRGARLLTSSRSHFFRSMSVVMLTSIASIFGDTAPAHAQSYFWLQFLAPVANSAALPSCADGSVYERRSIVTLAPSPGSIYQCPDGGGSWTCIVGADCPSTGTVTNVALSMPAEFSVSGSPITGTGTFSVTRATQAANRLLAGPTSGAAAVPTFRAITAADLGSGSATSSTYLRGDMTWAALSADPTLAGDVDGLGSANDLDEAAVESELESVLDLADMQGTLASDRITGLSPGVTDHGELTGLGDDDHSQYSLLAGRGSGQSLTGAVGATGYLKFNAHSGDGAGSIYFSSAVNTDTGILRLVYGGSAIYNGAMYAYGKGTYFVTCAGVGGGAGMIGCTEENDHYVVSRGFMVSTDGTFPGVAIRGAGSTGTGVSNQFVGLQMSSDTKIGWVNATNLTFSPTADLFIDRDRASMLRVSSTTDGTGGATLYIVPTDTAPTCNKKGIQWERASVDALCRCNGSAWEKIGGVDTCP